jgi:hypothetical protein
MEAAPDAPIARNALESCPRSWRILMVAPIPECVSLAAINAKRQPSLPLYLMLSLYLACGCFGIRFLAVFLTELFYATRRVHDLLFSGIERVTRGTYFHVQRFAQRRARSERVSATACHGDVRVLRVNFGFHVDSFLLKAGFALPKGADYPQESLDWQPRRQWIRHSSGGRYPNMQVGLYLELRPDSLPAQLAGLGSPAGVAWAEPGQGERQTLTSSHESKKSALFFVPRSLSTRN